MSRQPAHGKRRAERPKKGRRGREPKPAGGKRADRPENNEGITLDFLEQLREAETDLETPPVRFGTGGLGVREVLGGIDAELRADQDYLQALGRLAYG